MKMTVNEFIENVQEALQSVLGVKGEDTLMVMDLEEMGESSSDIGMGIERAGRIFTLIIKENEMKLTDVLPLT